MRTPSFTGRLKKIVAVPLPYHLLRLALAGIFLYGGGVKLLAPKAFAVTLSGYGLVPEPLLPVVAVGLPLAEVLAGIGLLFEVRGSLAVISALLTLFVFVLGYGILADLNVDCGCFGAEDLARQSSLREAFVRDVAILGVVVPYLYGFKRFRTRMGLKAITEEQKGE
jgi:hypothetical protein